LLTQSAAAHPLAPALLELREIAAGRTTVLWRTPASLPRAMGERFGPLFPTHCRVTEPMHSVRAGSGLTTRWEIACEGSLAGQEIEIRGLEASGASALLRLQLADGRRFQKLLDPLPDGQGSVFRIPLQSDPWTVLRDYSALGWRHIFSGPDHLLFVLGLMLWVRSRRQLLWTVTAFTLGHSLTLSLAVLGWIRVPARPVEALIALSIVALAVELARSASHGAARPSSHERARPPLLAAAFGLLHGLGFAGALAEIGLAQDEIPLSLLGFNLGIELGQLAFMAGVLGMAAAARQLPGLPATSQRALRWVPAYTIGSLAAFWFYERLFAGG
jgi:hydrogenase/urease accessory protein HupE